jgi:hypothetical protein
MQLAAPHMECIAWHAAYGIHMRQTAPRAASALLQCNTCNVTRDIQERHSQLQPISHSMRRAACSVQRGCRLQPQKRSRLSSPRALAAQRRLATSTWTLRGLAGRAASHPNPITHSHWHRCGPSCVRCGKAGIHPAHRRLTVAVTLALGRTGFRCHARFRAGRGHVRAETGLTETSRWHWLSPPSSSLPAFGIGSRGRGLFSDRHTGISGLPWPKPKQLHTERHGNGRAAL